MFSRRHPYLFFLLVSFALFTGLALGLLAVVAWMGGSSADFSGEAVGVVEIEGAITDSRDILEHIRRFREDEDIKAIVIRIDSPGGAVGPLRRFIERFEKPLKPRR
jgi:protease-4